MTPDFLTVVEVANYLRVSIATIYGWVHERRIPFRRHGTRLIFSREDLENWSKSREIRPLDDVRTLTPPLRGIRPKCPDYGHSSLKTEKQRTGRSSPTKEQEHDRPE